jgi:anion-transporting  ArsA/GET3 family ATPase
MSTRRSDLGPLVEAHHVVICCGSGGVGKTTTAAAIALEAARRGKRAVVVTIDPAKRLANALGLAGLSDTATEVHRGHWDVHGDAPPSGRLHALMLDTKSTFDRLVLRNSASAEQAERIYENRFYRNLSSALSGTQEYMAMEKLHELHDMGEFDVIVVDTPPTRHALDFLDAPRRLLRLLEHPLFRVLMMPTRAGMRAASLALRALLRTISRVVGSEVIDDTIAFFQAFEGMEEGFRLRARSVDALIADAGTAFVLVSSPQRDSLEEAQFFSERIEQRDLHVEALVVNRVHPRFTERSPEDLRAQASGMLDGATDDAMKEAAARLADLTLNLADFEDVARREREHLDALEGRIEPGAIAYVPYLAEDVYDFRALGQIADLLFRTDAGSRDRGR